MEILSRKTKAPKRLLSPCISFICLTLLAFSCSKMNRWLGLEDDHIIEEIAEDVIDSRLGWDIDLSPDTPERS